MKALLAEERASVDVIRERSVIARYFGRVGAMPWRLDAWRGTGSILDQAVVSGTTFGVSVIVGRNCHQSELGVFYLAFSLLILVRSIQEGIISAPYMVRRSRLSADDSRALTGSTLVHQASLSLVMVSMLAGAGLYFSADAASAGQTRLVRALLFAGPFFLLQGYVRFLALSHLRMRAALAVDIGASVLQIAGLLTLVHLGRLTATAAYVVVGVACALASLGWFVANCSQIRFDRSRVGTDWQRNWVLGRWALLSLLVGSSVPYFMPWIVVATHGQSATGVFAACMTLAGIAKLLLGGVSNYLLPRASQAFVDSGVDGMVHLLLAAAAALVAGIGMMCVLSVLAGESLVVGIYGSDYAGAGSVFVVLTFAVLATSLGTTAGVGIWAIGQPKANLIADLATLLVTLVAACALVPSLGVLGAAVATLLGAIVGAVVRNIVLLSLLSRIRSACLTT